MVEVSTRKRDVYRRRFAMLDEPNSALDPVIEAEIYAAYRKMLNIKTTLFVSHRLGSVKLAEKIYVLKDGHIIASGRHEELMNKCEYYSSMYDIQKGFYTT